MQGMSERQYAAHAGISRGAVQKARAAGRLVLFPDGSIDAQASDLRRAATTDPSKQRQQAGKPARLKPVSEAAVGAVRETHLALQPSIAVSLMGLPSLAVPVALHQGIPLGVQLVASRFEEERCFAAGTVIERHAPLKTPIDPVGAPAARP